MTSSYSSEEEFRTALSEWLDLFDLHLAEVGHSLPVRVFLATELFLKHAITRVENAEMDNRWSQPWYGEIFQRVRDWYVLRYGEAALAAETASATGIVLIYSTPFELLVPLTLRRPSDRDEHFWVVFPKEMMSYEKHEGFLVRGPSLEQESPETDAAKLRIESVVNKIRGIRNNLHNSKTLEAEATSLSSSILHHFSEGARELLNERPAVKSHGLWSCIFAVEKSLKLFLRHAGENPPNTHNLNTLHRRSVASGRALDLDEDVLSSLPNAGDAIAYRYGERIEESVEKCFQIYHDCLTAVERVTAGLQRSKIQMNNGSFLFEEPAF